MHRRTRPLRLELLEARAIPAGLPLAEVVYFSTDAAGSVIGSDGTKLSFDDSDILRLEIFRSETGQVTSYRYAVHFDGSDVGLSTSDEDIDAFAVLPDGNLVLSTTGRASVAGLTAEDEDLLLFTPAAGGLGFNTAGTWSRYFDGGDVGLAGSGEDIDGVAILVDGRMVVSTTGDASVQGATTRGEDLLVFTASLLGETTSGTWAKLFTGKAVGLSTSDEKIDALDIDPTGLVHLSTNGSFSVAGVSGRDEDVFSFDPGAGTIDTGLRLDGSQVGLASLDVDAVHFGGALTAPPPDEPPPDQDPPGLPTIDVAQILAVAQTKLARHDAANTNKTRYPRENSPGSSTWSVTAPSGWESGFYPGALWMMFEATGDPAWRARAEAWTAGLESQKNDTGTHDVGSKVFNSFGQGVRLTGDLEYRDIVHTAARTLSRRFDSDVGATRSWNSGSFKVIIDNMMNLELLIWSAKNGGSAALYDMAVSHAATTLANHVRADGSTYHVVDFSPTTGRVLSRTTHQGKSNESTWSRGQAWAVYGFTMVYRETGDPRFLEAARRTADYFIDHLPADFVPQADFQSTYTDLAHKDSSASAIAAAGLIELSTLESDSARQQRYWGSAVRMLGSLSSPTYFSSATNNAGLLLHGSRNYPGDNRSYMFGDYYFLEAVLRYDKVSRGLPLR
jgi:hypothetical protein